MRYRETDTVIHSLIYKCANSENAQSPVARTSGIVGGKGGKEGYEDRGCGYLRSANLGLCCGGRDQRNLQEPVEVVSGIQADFKRE